uniref:Uncharacterized protein n=1 Tax=Romanomermis culicivorax TaxID=13658 RepID=A0A915J5X2_ROMCU
MSYTARRKTIFLLFLTFWTAAAAEDEQQIRGGQRHPSTQQCLKCKDKSRRIYQMTFVVFIWASILFLCLSMAVVAFFYTWKFIAAGLADINRTIDL